MKIRERKYPMEEFARRGRDIYRRVVLPQVESHQGDYVAIDIDTESFELADDDVAATDRLLARLPDAQIWCERIGYPAVVRFGYWKLKR